jgi:predicted transcriptional regulator
MKTVAVRIPDEWKGRMDRADVKWSDILRQAIHETLQRVEREEKLNAYLSRSSTASVRKGTGATSVREDRDVG